MLSAVVLGGGALGRCLGHKGRAPMSRINDLIKETTENCLLSCLFSPCKVTARRQPSINQEACPQQTSNLQWP